MDLHQIDFHALLTMELTKVGEGGIGGCANLGPVDGILRCLPLWAALGAVAERLPLIVQDALPANPALHVCAWVFRNKFEETNDKLQFQNNGTIKEQQ